MTIARFFASAASLVALIGCSSHGSSAPPAPPPPPPVAANPETGGPVAAGGDLCGLLGPGDFSAAGVTGAHPVSSNNTPPTDYYCGYAGQSSFKGGIELDAFVSASPAEAATVFETVTKELDQGAATDRARELGVDQARLSTEAAGEPGPVATIAVRQGRFVFSLGFPSSPQGEAQLLSLARTVLGRAAGLR
jgi:hypothetical protein